MIYRFSHYKFLINDFKISQYRLKSAQFNAWSQKTLTKLKYLPAFVENENLLNEIEFGLYAHMQIDCISLHVVLMNSNQYCSTWRALTCDLWVTIPSWSPHKVHRTNKLQHIANRKLLLSIWEFSLSRFCCTCENGLPSSAITHLVYDFLSPSLAHSLTLKSN